MRLVLTVLLVASLTTGCLGSDPEQTDSRQDPVEQPAPAPPPAPRIREYSGEWSVDAAYGAVLVGGAFPLTGQRYMGFDASKGATVTAASTWDCATGPACEMALTLYDDEGRLIDFVEGPSPLELEITSPGGDMQAVMWASLQGSVVVDAQGTFEIVVVP